MKSRDKPVTLPELAHADLKGLSADQLQERLEAYFALHDDITAQQLVRELVHELQVHQIELEVQNRELQESQHQLEEARDRYADLYDFAPVCYLTLDDLGCIREINLTGATLLGMERTHLHGKPFNLWLTKEDGQAFFRHLQEVRQVKQVVTQEMQLRSSRGEQLDVRLETIANPELFDGKPSFRCVIIDITARKQAQWEVSHQAQQLQVIMDVVPAFVAYIDKQERYQFVNKAYASWFKQTDIEMIGRTVKEVTGDKAYSNVKDYIHLALTGTPVNFEWNVNDAEGREQVISASYIPDFGKDGSVFGYFVLSRDVTKQRQHDALDKMHLLETARVARINTMGEMVAELAHELNQPLAAITIYSDAVRRMLDKDTADVPEMQRALSEIRLQASRASEVIGRLREFVSKREIHNEQIQINTIIKEVMNLIAVEARWHGVMVILEFGEEVPPVMADRILIEQVILNLARNAIDAMDAIEQKKRCVTIKTASGAHKELVVAVEDTGPGLSVAEIEKIFEPYYTTKAQGMGMGLAISRTIIKVHQGRLWAIPNEYGGTTFTFTLPYQPEY